jgi:arylsulfate sulfotransferase
VRRFSRQGLFLCLMLIQAVFAFNCGQSSPSTSTSSSNLNSISVAISPGKSAVPTGGTAQLTASVSGTTQTGVNWSIISPSTNGGSIDSTGLYKAPAAALPSPVTIEAQSVATPSKSATAAVWVLAPGTVSTTDNPMVADYSITTPGNANVKIEFGPDTSYGLDTWTRHAPSGGGSVNILVAGMRAFSSYHLRAIVDLPNGAQFLDADHTFQTQGPSANLIPQIAVTNPNGLTPGGGVEMLGLDVLNPPDTKLEAVVTDLQGNLIWYYEFPEEWTTYAFPFPMRKPLPNGDILINVAPGTGGTGGPGDLREIDLAGNTIRDLTTAELNSRLSNAGFGLQLTAISHDILPLPNGHLILLVNYPRNVSGTNIVDDALVDLDENWMPVWFWDTYGHLDINRRPENWPDWTHANAVLYSPDDGDLILSMRHQNWIIKIDYQDGKSSGDVLWRLGYQGDFTLQGGTSPQDWFYAQHAPSITSPNSAGIFTMAVFDNGNYRRLDATGNECGTPGEPVCYSRVPIFQIDEQAKTAKIIWVDSLTEFSIFGGYVQQLLNGNVEFDICAHDSVNARLMEVTPDSSPQPVWQLDLTGQNAYRAFRIPSLYPGVQW